MHANLEFLENRIIKRSKLQSFTFRINENIGRPIVRLRRPYQIISARDADNDVAPRLLQRRVHRVPDETSTLSPPYIAWNRTEFFGDQTCDLVLKSFEPAVGKRKILRIRTDAKCRLLLLRENSTRAQQK